MSSCDVSENAVVYCVCHRVTSQRTRWCIVYIIGFSSVSIVTSILLLHMHYGLPFKFSKEKGKNMYHGKYV